MSENAPIPLCWPINYDNSEHNVLYIIVVHAEEYLLTNPKEFWFVSNDDFFLTTFIFTLHILTWYPHNDKNNSTKRYCLQFPQSTFPSQSALYCTVNVAMTWFWWQEIQ